MSDDVVPSGEMGFFCSAIAEECAKRGIVLRNKVTGREVRTASDVYNFDSHGELFHIWEWYATLFPDRVDPISGALLREPRSETHS